MSYILDALRRAEAERGRGAVPGLHSPALAASGAARRRAPAGRRMALLMSLIVLIVLGVALAAGAFWWAGRGSTPASGAVAASVAPSRSQSDLQPAPIAPAARPAPRPQVPGAPHPAPAGMAAAQPGALPPRPAPQPMAEERPSAMQSAARESKSTGTVFAQADLPASVREQLPNLPVAGVTYSSNASYRMAIINGQVLHEGEQAAPGLTLERIEPERIVWSFQGYRYSTPSK